jgi:heterodisulfide reductase subunit C
MEDWLMSEEKSAGVKPKREIRMCDIDPKFKYEMSGVPGFEKLRLCFQCGTCTADCPIARFSEIYHPRRLMRMTQLGMKDRVLGSEAIWLCAGCFTCVDHCPQGVDLAGVLRALRNIAAREGVVPPVFKELQSNISSTGYAYKIPELRVRKRVDKGLPDLPNTNVEAVAKLFKVLAKSKEEGE